MNTFEKTVLGVALLILLIGLAVIGSALKHEKIKTTEPAKCPDFWYNSYYLPCELTTNGCCADRVTASNATGSNCKACGDTTYGCCADGVTAKTSATDACSGDYKCFNVKKLGTDTAACRTPTYDAGILPSRFDESNGKSSLCKKQEFANSCFIAWDGVTNVASDC